MGAKQGNTNAEKWTLEEATKLLNDALELSYNEDYDFLGEIAKELKTYIDIFDYLTDKFPQLEPIKKQIKRNCETNCFSNSKKGNINTAIGIVNLKSNHGWTDRVETNNTNTNINKDVTPISFVKSNNDKNK